MNARVESMGGTTLEMMMPSTVRDIEAGGREQIAEQDAPLVGGLFVDRAQPPLKDADRGLRKLRW